MKSFTFLLAGFCLLAVAEEARSQDKRPAPVSKPLYNPMYSTHNYKHPGMAAAARSWQPKNSVLVEKPKAGDAQLANYKKQMPVTQPVGGITVGHTPTTNLADRNYKIQRLSEPKPFESGNEYYIDRKQRKADSVAVGD